MSDIQISVADDANTNNHTLAPKGGGWLAEARATALLAVPIVITQLAQMGVATVDVLLLGAYSKEALAASALGLSLFHAMWLFGLGPAVAVQPMIAHILGGRPGDKADVRACVRMTFWSMALLSPFLMLFLWFVEDVLLLIGQPADLSAEAGTFARILAIGLPFTLGFSVLRGYATALSRPRMPLIVMILTIFFNAALAYVLIFGRFGAPELGLMGAGIASTSAYIFSFVVMLGIVFLNRDLAHYRIFHRFGRLAKDKIAEVFRLGMPISMTMVFEAMFFNSGTLIMGYISTAAVAGHQIALNVIALMFMVPLGIATAATVRVGLAAGAGDMARVRRSGLVAMGMGLLFMLCVGVPLAIFSDEVAGLYIDGSVPGNAEVVQQAGLFLLIGSSFLLLDGMQVIASLALRGLKDTTWPMWVAGGSYWLVGFPSAVALTFHFKLDGAGVWFAFVIALVVAAALLSLRFALLSGMIGRRKHLPHFA